MKKETQINKLAKPENSEQLKYENRLQQLHDVCLAKLMLIKHGTSRRSMIMEDNKTEQVNSSMRHLVRPPSIIDYTAGSNNSYSSNQD